MGPARCELPARRLCKTPCLARGLPRLIDHSHPAFKSSRRSRAYLDEGQWLRQLSLFLAASGGHPNLPPIAALPAHIREWQVLSGWC